jgi:hypothetical protein
MTSAIFNITFDCRDARGVAESQSAVTGFALQYVDMPGTHSGSRPAQPRFANVLPR